MSLEKWLSPASCPINLWAEHCWVHVHVVETLVFLHIQQKDEIFANIFHHLVAVGNYIISPTLQLLPLASLSLKRAVELQDSSSVKWKEQRTLVFSAQQKRQKYGLVNWSKPPKKGEGGGRFSEGGSCVSDTEHRKHCIKKRSVLNKWLEEHNKKPLAKNYSSWKQVR